MTPEVFVRIKDGKAILWDYMTHAQYELDAAHLNRLVQLTGDAVPGGSPVDQALVQCGVLQRAAPADWGWDCLSRMFHIGTQIRLAHGESLPLEDGYRGYVDYCASIASTIPPVHTELAGQVVPLPAPDLRGLAAAQFWQTLEARVTCRCFDGATLSLGEVATTLWATFGAIHGASRTDLLEQGLLPVGYRRSSPSGGSMQPSEAYLVALRVEGLAPGIYHYRSHRHELTRVDSAFEPAQLGPLLCGQSFANDLSFGVFITSRFDKLWWKYPHSRAYRVALLDAGCLAQTFQLVCTAQQLQSWPTGYFFDQEINRLLQLDEACESVLFFLGAGTGHGAVAREAVRAARQIA